MVRSQSFSQSPKASRDRLRFVCDLLLITLGAISTSCSLAPPSCGPSADAAASWTVAGNDLHNTRFQCAESLIGPANVGDLETKWVTPVGGDVSATPTTDGITVYFPDWANNLNALNAETGETVWRKPISTYDNLPASCRTSPVIVDNGAALIIGDRIAFPGGPGASVIKVDAKTGERIWITNVDNHPASQVSASAAVVDSVIFVTVSSSEEAFAFDANYPCCTFRGSVVALDETTGTILWRTYMVPDNNGLPNQYSGGAIWGSTPMVDRQRRLVYVGTGNNYSVPHEVAACQLLLSEDPTCIDPENRIDSVVALDIASGAVRWTFHTRFSDIVTNGCSIGVNCVSPQGPDQDFAQGPVFVQGSAGALVFAGNKSGMGYALNPDTGALIWSTQPGMGMMWGSATDNKRIYVANRVSLDGEFGSWSALDPVTGKILWTTSDPGRSESLVRAIAPVTVANGVVYAASTNASGATMFGLDAENGEILFSFNSGTPVGGGPAVANGVVYWGSGYPPYNHNRGSKGIFAFHLPHQGNRE